MRHVAFSAAALLLVAMLAGCPPGTDSGAGLPEPGSGLPSAPGEEAGAPAFSSGVQEVDERAPEFYLLDTQGQDVSLGDYTGSVLVLDFWATWCAPCVKKLKEYEPIIQKYEGQGVDLLAVSLDSRPEVAAGWAQKNEFTFRIAMLDDAMQAAYFPEVRGSIPIPQVRIIDRDGNLRFRFGPESTVEDFELALSRLVEETVGGDASVTEEILETVEESTEEEAP